MFLRGKKSIKLVQNARVVTNRAPLVLAAIRCQQTRNITFTKQARFENFSNFKQNTFHRYTQLFTKSIIRSYSTPNVIEVGMPALSPTMKEGTIANWVVKEGDSVSAGDVLAEIQTDKAVVELETQEEGYVAKILYPKGAQNVPIGETIVLLVENKEDIEKVKDYTPKGKAIQQPAEEPKKEVKVEEKEAPKQEVPKEQPKAEGRIIASPYAKKLASERGVDLSAIQGTGPRGRIVAADVEEFTPTPKPTRPPTTPTTPVTPTVPTQGAYTDIPVTPTRKVIAERLLESKQTIPHYYLTVTCEIDELLKVREYLNKKSESKGIKLSVNDFIIKAASRALREVPEVNSSWQGSFIRQYHNADISVAVATDGGLITPIVFDANSKGLAEISSETKRLAQKAREGKLQLEEFVGGTFTISNLGMFGIKEFAAVINPPQAAILAVGGAEKVVKPVISNDGNQEFKTVTTMTVTLSCDHRVIDGAVGAKWLNVFKETIENPLYMLL